MKFLIAFTLAIAYAAADASYDDSSVVGTFQWGYQSDDAINPRAAGVVENANSDNSPLKVTRSFGYKTPDGTPVDFSYTADKYGYHSPGDSIPVGPAVP